MSNLLNQSEAASFLRLSERTLERLRCTGGGPKFCKLGRRVLYLQSDLDAWVAARIVGSTSEALFDIVNSPSFARLCDGRANPFLKYKIDR